MQVSAELRDTFRRLGSLSELTPKSTLLEQGEVCTHAYFVESGCLRLWHTEAGSDVSVKFFLRGELCASLDSIRQELPSNYGIESIVPSIVRKLPRKILESEVHQSSGLRDYMSSVMVHCAKDYQQLFLERIAKSPTDRYRALLEEEPDVLEIVPLHCVASFLGITPVSLCRIRAKVASS